MFDPVLHQATLARHQLERDLRDAVKHDELFLLYQPIVHLAHNDIVGVEALIRWEHPTRGVISPVEFIPLAEANGSINDIGDWVLERAIRPAPRMGRRAARSPLVDQRQRVTAAARRSRLRRTSRPHPPPRARSTPVA